MAGRRRFQDPTTSLKGIAPSILSDRLKLVEAHGLVARRLDSAHPPRDLGVVIGALASGGARRVDRGTRLIHEGCGHAVRGYFCPGCGDAARGVAVRYRRP